MGVIDALMMYQDVPFGMMMYVAAFRFRGGVASGKERRNTGVLTEAQAFLQKAYQACHVCV